MPRSAPPWVLVADYVDVDLGTLKTGKEAEIRVVERRAHDGTSRHLLADKRYRPKSVTFKGELEVLGFTRSASFRNDVSLSRVTHHSKLPRPARDRQDVPSRPGGRP